MKKELRKESVGVMMGEKVFTESFIDEHFVEKGECTDSLLTDIRKILERKNLYTKEQVLELTGEEHLLEDWKRDLRRAGYEGGFLLGQLIEACGDRFICIQKHYGKNPFAYSNTDEKITWYEATHNEEEGWDTGSTPEEAVARLWLALNKK